ncbi:MAG TPA: low temperature requirement protein A [Pseudonocardiaceae bacterium]|jgi:low temperature requirement protein LtrA
MTGSRHRPSVTIRTDRPAVLGTWRRVMMARDREQEYRSSTPLELFYDLCFVVAVAQAGSQLHHGLGAGPHGGNAWLDVLRYAMLFFAIWWAWINFTWFASAYDTDDVFYRLLTLLQMAGVLVIAAGMPAAFESFNFTIMTFGYVIMRVAMIAQWIRVWFEYPPGRPAALRYAVGIGLCQAGWVIRLFLPHPWDLIFFGVFALCEMLVPVWAETRGRETSWHPDHISDRYSCFTLIVLGECVSALTIAVQGVVSSNDKGGVPVSLIVLAVAALLLVFGLWWAYFKTDAAAEILRTSLRTTMVWAYTHFFIFASVAALGATLSVAAETAADLARHPGEATLVSPDSAALMVALPVAVFLLTGNVLHSPASRIYHIRGRYVIVIAAVIIGLSWTADAVGLAATVGMMAIMVAALLVAYVIGQHRAAVRMSREHGDQGDAADPEDAGQATAATG